MDVKTYIDNIDKLYRIENVKSARRYKDRNREDLDYKLEPLSSDEAMNILTTYLLGPDWYCVDPLGKEQVNALIVDDIIKNYRGF